MMLPGMTVQSMIANLIALIAGLLLPLAFAPFYIAYLAIVSTGLLLLILLRSSPKQAFWRGFLYGIGAFGFGVSWIFVSVHTYGNSPVFVAALLTVLFVLYLSLFIAVPSYLLNKVYPANNVWKCCLAFPALWVLFEWLRGWLLTGFPWLLVGYSQTNTAWHGIAAILGVYGVSLVIIYVAGALVSCLYTKRWITRGALLASVVALWLTIFGLNHIDWVYPNKSNIRVSLVQGNVPQELKWRPEQVQQILHDYERLTAENWHSQLIIWPEAAVTITNVDAQNYLTYMSDLAKQHNTTIIAGIPIYDGNRYYNGVMTLGNGEGEYRKRHLVPFGEFMPLRSILNFMNNYVMIPMSDFSRGNNLQPPLRSNNITVAPFVCYEIAYLNEVLPSLPNAELLVVVTDDSWFGKSFAAAQHLQIAQLRAIETGRYLLFASNNGITAIINPQGQLVATAPEHQQYVLSGEVSAMKGSTPLVMMGPYPSLFLAGLLAIAAILFCRRKKVLANDKVDLKTTRETL